MAQLATQIDGMMIISVNDIPEMREVFSELHTDSRPIKYTVGGGCGSDARELLVWNENAEAAPKQNWAQMNLV